MIWVVLGLCGAGVAAGIVHAGFVRHMGLQSDGSFIVSTGQHVGAPTFAFDGRPADMALRPDGSAFAVMKPGSVFLCTEKGVVPGSAVKFSGGSGFHGMTWSDDGAHLYCSTESGAVQVFDYDGRKLTARAQIRLVPDSEKQNPVPGGMCLSKDGGMLLYVTSANLNRVFAVDLATNTVTRSYETESMPFEPRLSPDGKTLIVSNWAGRLPAPGDAVQLSQELPMVVNRRSSAETGTISLIDLTSGRSTALRVGIHPSGMALSGHKVYVANSMSDTISEIDLDSRKVTRTIALRWKQFRLFGSMPIALVVDGCNLYAADGGDNAVAVVDLKSGVVKGFHPAGYFPIEMFQNGRSLVVLNSKGDGSVAKTAHGGKSGNAHNFEGSVTVVPVDADLGTDTATVAADNAWTTSVEKPKLAVYNGAIKHVIYIIKENRTYDEIFGDMPKGNGDPTLCDIGEKIMPNHHALARMFTLFDNGYVSGTNSADGHNWCDEALCDDYLEHFYVGYSRTYPDDGSDPMALSSTGCIWDAALKKHKTIRDYGEFTDPSKAKFLPRAPRNWWEMYDDYKSGSPKITPVATSDVRSLQPYIDRNYLYWPLLMSDQQRASEFIREYTAFSKAGNVPDLIIMSLPSDHTEGVNQTYPLPRSMMADNDLALGRIVAAVSHSPQWKDTCIFVIEDDAQAGPDHVDGHRTAFQVFSPYVKHRFVDSNMYTTVNMVKSIEVMLGIDPMNRFDFLARPIDTCFNDTPDLTPYEAVPNQVPIGEHAPRRTAMNATWRNLEDVTRSLDWSHLDAPDPDKLNHIIWATLHPDGRPYPEVRGKPATVRHSDDD